MSQVAMMERHGKCETNATYSAFKSKVEVYHRFTAPMIETINRSGFVHAYGWMMFWCRLTTVRQHSAPVTLSCDLKACSACISYYCTHAWNWPQSCQDSVLTFVRQPASVMRCSPPFTFATLPLNALLVALTCTQKRRPGCQEHRAQCTG